MVLWTVDTFNRYLINLFIYIIEEDFYESYYTEKISCKDS